MAPTNLIRKTYLCETKAIDEQQGIFDVMITTEVKDRQGDFVSAEGGKLDNYMKNPVVMFAHDYDKPPVARTLELEVLKGKGIRARFQFPPIGTYDFADTIHGLWSGKFLNAASIGFMPGQEESSVSPIWDENGDAVKGTQYNDWELLEFSIVPVPANQTALRLALKALGEDAVEIKPYPNEHACRQRDPGDFESDSFRRTKREHEGKEYFVIMGKLKGESTMTEQSYRYPKDIWTEAEARKHCKSHGGISFEPAQTQEGAANTTTSNIPARIQLTSDERKAVADALSKYFEILKGAIS